jgi:hypothetical protein
VPEKQQAEGVRMPEGCLWTSWRPGPDRWGQIAGPAWWRLSPGTVRVGRSDARPATQLPSSLD